MIKKGPERLIINSHSQKNEVIAVEKLGFFVVRAMFLRRLLKTPQISSSVGTMRTISSSLHATSSTPSSPALKRKIFANLKSSEKPCDDLLRDMEEQGFEVAPNDLTRWANLLEKKGQEEKALEILSFMDWKCCLMMSKSVLRPAGNYSSKSDSEYLGRSTFRRIAKKIAPSVVNIDGPNNCYGSGIFFGEEGKIITCAHIVLNLHKFAKSPVYRSKQMEVKITLNCGKTFRGFVADCDPEYDLAVVKIEAPSSFSPAKFGISKDAAVGDMVLSVGNPFGFADSFSGGIISCVNRSKKEIMAAGNCQFYLQTDCALNEGNSGGPLVNLDGEVIGINCAFGDGDVGVGFAIPIDTVLKVIKERNW
ncbi:hypothetical protein HA466_0139340 [Hirschfeldia incana]|nr:hypothetical protein HA466_0139340 [Hirschfeldia incana]